MRYVLIAAVLLTAGCAKEPTTQPIAPYMGPNLVLSSWEPPPRAARPAYQPMIFCSHVGNFTMCN